MSTSWADLSSKLDSRIMAAIKEFGFEAPTPVQAACIPLMLDRKDVVAEAVTGSGKTLTYLVPLIQTILNVEREERTLRNDAVYAIVILPTRELAAQVYAVLKTFQKHAPTITSALITTGKNRNIAEQTKRLTSGATHILVSTPGRLSTFLETTSEVNLLRKVKLLELLVLDEADRLLELGFYETLQRIVIALPKQRRTSLFSATQTGDIEQLVRAGLRNPVRVTVRDRSVAAGVKPRVEATHVQPMEVDQSGSKPASQSAVKTPQVQPKSGTKTNVETGDGSRTPNSLCSFYTVLERDAKLPFIEAFIRHHVDAKVLIFTATCLCATYLHTVLRTAFRRRADYILRLHRKTHSKRDAVLQRFAAATRGAVLVCTDVLARGIDVPDVDWVIQLDAPAQARTYLHRAGRTARRGRSGSSLLLLAPTETAYLRFLSINQQVALATFEPDFKFTLPGTPNVTESKGTQAQTNILERCARLVQDDPLMRLRAIRAFTSYIRFYSKHEAHLIFRIRDIEVDALARFFGLRHVPKMPELAFWRPRGAKPPATTDESAKQRKGKTGESKPDAAAPETGSSNGNNSVRFRNKTDAKTYERLLKHFADKRQRAEKRQAHVSWSRSHPQHKRTNSAQPGLKSNQSAAAPKVTSKSNLK